MDFEDVSWHGIYRTPLEQAMARPTYEPSDIDVSDLFEHPDNFEFFEHINEEIPDPVLRCDFLDLWSESRAVGEYRDWVFDCGRAAISCGDGEKEKSYEDLVNAILVDEFVVSDEYRLKYEEIFGEKLGSHGWEEYRDQPFRFRDVDDMPYVFQTVARDIENTHSRSQAFSSASDPERLRASTTDQGDSSQSDSRRDGDAAETQPRSKSSKTAAQ